MIDYDQLSRIVFRDDYPGYRPTMREAPNGDGKVDQDKRFAHVADKYLDAFKAPIADIAVLEYALFEAHQLAVQVALRLGVPADFMPDSAYGALRVLDYPPGATSALHTDFDLFTVMIYRDTPECFVAHPEVGFGRSGFTSRLRHARQLNPQLHLGEIGELVGLGPATPHEVIASPKRQRSVVYFAIPNHAAQLPSGQTVGAWIDERIARSRISVAR